MPLPWASEGFLPGGALRDFSKIFPGVAKSGEIYFFPLTTTKKTTFFVQKIKKNGGEGPFFRRPLPQLAFFH